MVYFGSVYGVSQITAQIDSREGSTWVDLNFTGTGTNSVAGISLFFDDFDRAARYADAINRANETIDEESA